MKTSLKILSIVLAALVMVSPARPSGGAAPVRLRTNTSHAVESARGAVVDCGLRPGVEVVVTSSSAGNSPFLPPDRFLSDGEGAGATILSSSFSGWHYLFDSVLYDKLVAKGMLHVYAYVPLAAQPSNIPPPAAFATVNRVGGKTGDGIEFGVPDRYLNGRGGSTTSSGATAQLAGLMACLKYRHPSWNWFDVKAALRSTAANFDTGYDPRAYGYGTIDYPAAAALENSASLPLFPPAAIALPQRGNYLPFRVNSFRQTRRVADALFKFASPPATHPGELTLAEITAMGGQLLFSGDPAPGPNLVAYQVKRDETACFVWFSRDGQGRYSRIESYSIIGPVRMVHVAPQVSGPRLEQGAEAPRKRPSSLFRNNSGANR